MNENAKKVISLYDGKKSSVEVAKIVGLSPRYVRRIATKFDLERLWVGAQPGSKNHQFVSGRRIDLAGYVLITCPPDHPFARQLTNRKGKIIYEHRLVLEQKIGRYMLPEEVVDHKDGLTLHNDPLNLRLFHENSKHLYDTLKGKVPKISQTGMMNIQARNHLPEDYQHADTYGQRKKRGDLRLRQILLAALQFGIDSPYLLGTHHHLEKIGIDWSSRSNLELALAELIQRWEADLLL